MNSLCFDAITDEARYNWAIYVNTELITDKYLHKLIINIIVRLYVDDAIVSMVRLVYG